MKRIIIFLFFILLLVNNSFALSVNDYDVKEAWEIVKLKYTGNPELHAEVVSNTDVNNMPILGDVYVSKRANGGLDFDRYELDGNRLVIKRYYYQNKENIFTAEREYNSNYILVKSKGSSMVNVYDKDGSYKTSFNSNDELYIAVTKAVKSNLFYASNGTTTGSVSIGVGNISRGTTVVAFKTNDTSTQSKYIISQTFNNNTASMNRTYCLKLTYAGSYLTKIEDYSDQANNISKSLYDTSYFESLNQTDNLYSKWKEQFLQNGNNDATTLKALGLAEETKSANDIINSLNVNDIDRLKSADEVYKYLKEQGVEEETAKKVKEAIIEKIKTLSTPSYKVESETYWMKYEGEYTLFSKKTDKPVKTSGWVLTNDSDVKNQTSNTYHLYELDGNGRCKTNNWSDTSQQYMYFYTDNNGYGIVWDKLVEVGSTAEFSNLISLKYGEAKEYYTSKVAKDQLNLGSSQMQGSSVGSVESSMGSGYSGMSGITSQNPRLTGDSIINTDNVGPTSAQSASGGRGVGINIDPNKANIGLTYDQQWDVYSFVIGDKLVIENIPRTNFTINWPKKFYIENGNLKSKSHYVPTKEEIQEIIRSLYSSAPNGADNLIENSFSAMNREANESYPAELTGDLRRLYGGDFFDTDKIVDPMTIVSANLDCIKYSASSANWNSTPLNAWISSESNNIQDIVMNAEFWNMILLKSYGEYQYYSVYTVNESKNPGVVTLYVTRSAPEQYSDFKDSLFKCDYFKNESGASRITKDTQLTFNDLLVYLYYLDKRYSPLRDRIINMEQLTQEDYDRLGLTSFGSESNIYNVYLKEACYYLIDQGMFTIDEVVNGLGRKLTLKDVQDIPIKIYNTLNRGVNINTRVK